MDQTNHWYGHAHVLAEYCGLDPAAPPPIRGMLQHGWTVFHGFGYHQPADASFARYVWSDVARRRGQIVSWRDFVVTGAPFAYLNMMKSDDSAHVEPRGTIWYPFHGTLDYEKVNGSHQRLVDEIKATEPGPVTACLYYVEYDNPDVRRSYEEAGFRVICHGRRGWMREGTDRFFLFRQLDELRRHRRVASNRLSTAVMYGAAIGCEPAVYGDPMEFVGARPGFSGEGLLEALYPDFFGSHPDPKVARSIARLELGMDQLLGPRELSYLLGWDE